MTGPGRRPRLTVLLTITVAGVVLLPPQPAEASAVGLSISVPSTVSLGSRSAGGGTITHALGTVTVTTSALAGQSAGWVATVSATAFKTGGGTAGETVGASSISYLSGAAITTVGLIGACTPGQLVTAVALGSPATAFTCTGTGSVGGTSVTWNPQITVTIGASNVAGTYSGTITHSVV